MSKGALYLMFSDRPHPMVKIAERSIELMGEENQQPMAPRLFGNAGLEYIKKYGGKVEHFIKIAAKNHRNGSRNPYAQFQSPKT